MPDQILAITIPPGYGPGQNLVVQAPNGQQLQIQIPPGMFGGQQLQVAVPSAPSIPAPPIPPPPGFVPPSRSAAKQNPWGPAGKAVAKNTGIEMRGRASDRRGSGQASTAAPAPSSAYSGGYDDFVNNLEDRPTHVGPDPLAGVRASRGKNVSNDPLGDLLRGDIWQMPPVYEGSEAWLKNLSEKLRRDAFRDDVVEIKALGTPIWDGEITIPTIDALENTSSVPASDGYLHHGEKGAIRSVLKSLEGDATSNVKLRTLRKSLITLPKRLSRPQVEALLRTIDIPMRRADAIDILRERIQPNDAEWADEISKGKATTERIRELCGDGK